MFHDFLSLIFPRLCNSCEKILLSNENVICTRCLHELPVTNYHLENEEEIKKVFYGRVNIEHATALLLFEKKGMVQKLIHNLKYRGQEDIGAYLGTWMGTELLKTKAYREISSVVPVPLHKSRLRQRGYNQVEQFGRKIAYLLNVPYVDNVLVKKQGSGTQTIKRRFARWGTIDATFQVEGGDRLEGHHILLVDDLVTTGATLEACATKLLSIPGTKVSIATMAVTH